MKGCTEESSPPPYKTKNVISLRSLLNMIFYSYSIYLSFSFVRRDIIYYVVCRFEQKQCCHLSFESSTKLAR